MAWLGNIANTVLQKFLPDVPGNHVQEVRTNNYHKRHIHCREDGIVLYTPENVEKEKYDIVLHRPCTETLHQGYSLFRSDNLEEAESRFIIYKDRVPVLMKICREIGSVNRIQKLCDTLVEHPTWNLAHISAHLLLYDAFNHDVVNSLLNSSDEETGASPLQVAIQTNNLRIVQMLISAKSSLEHLDFKLNTVYHYAANSTKDIILALGSDLPNTLNSRNSDGYTPMHIACLNDKPEYVKALLLIGADVNIPASEGVSATTPGFIGDFLHNQPNSLKTDDMKFGGTPLHWSCSREVMNALIEKNCNIDALNFEGRTALHIMVIRKRLECVAALLSHMANINIVDKEGNSPLHLAVTQSTPTIVQLLIAFGAEINAKNWKSQSPRHLVNIDTNDGQKILYILHAVGAERCPTDMKGCSIGCKHNENFDGVAPPEPPTVAPRTVLDQMLYVSSMEKMATKKRKRTKGGRLLCLDGGGIRGLVLVQTLLEVESVLQKPISSCFDWISGTSTGGILALGIATGKNLKECQALYFRIKDNAFVGRRPYDSEPLENALKETLGEVTVMADIQNPKLMITGVLADRKPVDLHLFRNYDSPSKILNVPVSDKFKATLEPEEQLLWKAARATGAAPSYFRAFGRFLDGGLIANNPTLDAMTEIHEYNLALEAVDRSNEVVPLSLVVSVGTGLIPMSPLQNVDVYRPGGIFDTAKLAMGISTLATLVVDQATASDGRVVDRARTWCSMIGVPYYRLNPQLSAEVPMDEKSDTVLAEMMWTAKAFMHANRDQIKELAAVLSSVSDD
ncbi:85/88 kDa calcium-independent phospholipase A2 isoform X1 [Nasonia vitripennis]|uniref:phospholipase A2 n=2 Tax=Nasonia vitripennis TaxID=7425 RepID=A0A7M7TD14_NASVI|nr:85/88 kDa calcium-independent phospholipase A2 isoform X1 [Nasonia vitripennis]XP_032454541.1 85/88 kDa calcium-independent phospholipase A2 isoform X1 [Nasonia vitripennis]